MNGAGARVRFSFCCENPFFHLTSNAELQSKQARRLGHFSDHACIFQKYYALHW